MGGVPLVEPDGAKLVILCVNDRHAVGLLQNLDSLHAQYVWRRHRPALIIRGRIIGSGTRDLAVTFDDRGRSRRKDRIGKIAHRPVAIFPAVGLPHEVADRTRSRIRRFEPECRPGPQAGKIKPGRRALRQSRRRPDRRKRDESNAQQSTGYAPHRESLTAGPQRHNSARWLAARGWDEWTNRLASSTSRACSSCWGTG